MSVTPSPSSDPTPSSDPAAAPASFVPPVQSAERPGVSTPLLVTLAVLSAVAPFSTDLYLPAFPQMSTELATSDTAVQLSLTAFLIGAGVGQLVFGPVSDRLGRRWPLLIGLMLFLASSCGTAMAPSIGVLIPLRLVQGISGAAGMVIGRAVIADRSHGRAAARALSLMMMVGGLAPVIAPLLGSGLAGVIGWRGLLWIVAGLGLAGLVASVVFVPETNDADARARRAAADAALAAEHPGAGGVRALATRTFIGRTLAFAFAFATMMAYISASPFVYQRMIGLSVPAYGLLFGLNALLLMLVSAISARLVAVYGAERLLRIGLITNLVGSAATLLVAVTGVPVWLLTLTLPIAVAPLGLVFGNATALALDAAPARVAGLGSAILGLAQFALAGLVSPLVSLGGEGTATPLGIVMVTASVVAMAMFLVGRSRTSILEG